MRNFLVKAASRVKGEIVLLGDKSIAHRSIIISAITPGKTVISNFPFSEDCISTLKVFRALGIKITADSRKNTITVFGKGLYGLKQPKNPVMVGDSGTTLRLVLGVLAGQDFRVVLKAGKSLFKRPMLRVTAPLRKMGARISARRVAIERKIEEYPPITIKGGALASIVYRVPVASAQVKSAILLAGLYSKKKSSVRELVKTRDHTERMLKLFAADIKVRRNEIFISGNRGLVSPGNIYIPADISSASFFIVLSVILPDSKISLPNVTLNPSRTGIIRILKRMKANIDIKLSRPLGAKNDEPMGDIIVESSNLRGTVVSKDQIPSLIDELPILMVAACFARGETVFEGVEELRVKETDRVKSMLENLKKMGARIEIINNDEKEKIVIQGIKELKGSLELKSFGDHRTAMSMIIAALKASGNSKIEDTACINKSFPGFLKILKKIIQ